MVFEAASFGKSTDAMLLSASIAALFCGHAYIIVSQDRRCASGGMQRALPCMLLTRACQSQWEGTNKIRIDFIVHPDSLDGKE